MPQKNKLLAAVSNGDVIRVNELLKAGADVNARGEFGENALNLAAQGGHQQIVERLLEAHADIENVGGANMTPLMNAAVGGNVGIVRLLLSHGARISDDLLGSVQLKVSILEENAESGMVRPEATEAWKSFLDYLTEARNKQVVKG